MEGRSLAVLVLGAVLSAAGGASGAESTILATAPVTGGSDVLISCNITEPATKISGHQWLKGSTELLSDESSSAYTSYRINTVDHETSGEYNCIFKTDPLSKATVFVKVKPHVTAYKKFEHGNEGDTGVLVCKSSSYPPVTQWSWFKVVDGSDQLISNGTDERFYIKSDHNYTELRIYSLDIEKDPGEYKCNGTNEIGGGQALVELRVRSHLAALWPFLGIVAEVLVLVTIIFIYEKRRKPDESPEDEDEGAAPLKSNASNDKDKNVRQRNAN